MPTTIMPTTTATSPFGTIYHKIFDPLTDPVLSEPPPSPVVPPVTPAVPPTKKYLSRDEVLALMNQDFLNEAKYLFETVWGYPAKGESHWNRYFDAYCEIHRGRTGRDFKVKRDALKRYYVLSNT